MEVYFMFHLTPGGKRNNLEKRSKDAFDVERLFEGFFSDSFFPTLYGNGNMKVDIMENEKEYLLEAELPGIQKHEIGIDLRDDRLTISVQRNEEVHEERENYIRRERKTGSLSRVFYVPHIKQDEVRAKYDNGILKVVLPKQEGSVIRNSKIEIE
jgi:HSP20 family protein